MKKKPRNAHSIACGYGFPYIGSDGEGYKNAWFSKFYKNAERTGPCLYVGFVKIINRWEVYYDKLPDFDPYTKLPRT